MNGKMPTMLGLDGPHYMAGGDNMRIPPHPAFGKWLLSSKSSPGQKPIALLAQEIKAVIAGKTAKDAPSARRSSQRASRRDPRPLALAVMMAALLAMTLLTSSVSISPVYDREAAPLAAQQLPERPAGARQSLALASPLSGGRNARQTPRVVHAGKRALHNLQWRW